MEDPTELHEAAWLGKHELLEHLLLDGQYDIDSEDWTYEKKTPLHVAVEAGKLRCIRTLLQHGADPNSKTKSGMTPAHIAAEQGSIECLQLLMGYNASIAIEDNVGAIPIDIARVYGHEFCVRFLEMSNRLKKEVVNDKKLTKNDITSRRKSNVRCSNKDCKGIVDEKWRRKK